MRFQSLLFALTAMCFGLAMMAEEGFAQSANSGEPGWYPYIVARGQDRAMIESTPITARPYRPMHFYGNSVRRKHYRGNAAALPRDFVRATSAIVRRR